MEELVFGVQQVRINVVWIRKVEFHGQLVIFEEVPLELNLQAREVSVILEIEYQISFSVHRDQLIQLQLQLTYDITAFALLYGEHQEEVLFSSEVFSRVASAVSEANLASNEIVHLTRGSQEQVLLCHHLHHCLQHLHLRAIVLIHDFCWKAK